MLAHCKRLRLLRARPSLLRASPPPPVRAGSRSLRSAGAALPLRPLALARRPAGPPLAPRARLCVRVAFRSVAHAAFARASGVAPPRRRRLNPRALVALASLALLFRSARAGPPALRASCAGLPARPRCRARCALAPSFARPRPVPSALIGISARAHTFRASPDSVSKDDIQP